MLGCRAWNERQRTTSIKSSSICSTRTCTAQIDRRAFLDRAGKFAVGRRDRSGAPRRAQPEVRRGAAGPQGRQAAQDRVRRVQLAERAAARCAAIWRDRPSASGKLPAVLVVHENRGLNPHIEDIARRLALDNFIAFAPDALTPLGGYPGDEDKARELFAKLDQTQDARGLRGSGEVAEEPPRLHGQGRRGRILLRRRHRQHARDADAGPRRAVPFYGSQPAAERRPEDQSAAADPLRGERRARQRRVAGRTRPR